MKPPLRRRCALCAEWMLIGQPAFHKEGVPHVHRHHFEGAGDRHLAAARPVSKWPPSGPLVDEGRILPQATTGHRAAPAPNPDEVIIQQPRRGRRIRRSKALFVDCPSCGAGIGERCRGPEGAWAPTHRARHRATTRYLDERARRA
jgi:hypothetical protein